MDLGLKGMKAIVTGGSKGIGRHCAEVLADEGCNVAICARDSVTLDSAVASLKNKGVKAFGQAIDVADKAQLEGWVEASAEALGGIDIVIANVSALALEDNEEAWHAGFNTDLMHSIRAVNASMPYLEKSHAGSITLISSVSGREVDFTGPAYGTMKAALVHYAQRLANQLAPKMIRANSVSPGNVYFEGGVWEWVEQNNPELFKTAMDLNPTGRMTKPEEVARGVVFLASPASSFTTGTNLVIDGALTRGVQT